MAHWQKPFVPIKKRQLHTPGGLARKKNIRKGRMLFSKGHQVHSNKGNRSYIAHLAMNNSNASGFSVVKDRGNNGKNIRLAKIVMY